MLVLFVLMTPVKETSKINIFVWCIFLFGVYLMSLFYAFLSVDSKAIDVNARIDEQTMQQLKDLGLFGQQIPQEYGEIRALFMCI